MATRGTQRFLHAAFIGFLVPFALGSCALFDKDSSSDPAVSVPISYDSNNPVTKLDTTVGLSRVQVSGLSGQSVFLLKCNLSANEATSGSTGMIDSSSIESDRSAIASTSGSELVTAGLEQGGGSRVTASTASASGDFGSITRLEHARALNYSLARASRATSANLADNVLSVADITAYEEAYKSQKDSATHDFYVEGKKQLSGNQYWTTAPATLRGVGKHCMVWVANANYNEASSGTDGMIASKQINDLVSMFDKLYEPETSILGRPYGDAGSMLINILVFDIDGDYTATQTDGVVGYFWAKDLFPDSFFGVTDLAKPASTTNLVSNKAEIFYLDANFIDQYPYIAYSTLAHEFQHMIGYNRKNLQLNIWGNMPTWYDEMLSMVTEDMLAPVIGIKISDKEHPVAARIPYFNYYYRGTGLTYWANDASDAEYAYPFSYAFGAYLARNYGGAKLVKGMMDSSSVGLDSVSAALSSLGYSDDFNAAFLKFGEALVFNSSTATPSGVNTFNRAPATYSVTGASGTTYAYDFTPFNIWGLPNAKSGYGPSIFQSGDDKLWAYGISVESCDALLGVSGTVTFDVEPPTDSNVALYIMVR
ncbi:MAG TPA: hypothetical protein PK542_01035 [Treponemataceae bacterium]|nr:hypothetical protein [Treponemataceae bacterium]HPS43050.1 hypothetical protein [Treponemataceae bacterium]